MRFKSFFISVLLVILATLSLKVSAQQTKTKLEEEKRKIEKEITYTNNLLKEVRKNRESSINELVILNNKIKRREELIATITSEITVLENRIEKNRDEVRKLNKELAQLKEEYASLIYYAYKNRSTYDRLMFVFSAETFNQAYQRLKYLQQYSAYRKTQAELITNTTNELAAKVEELENKKAEQLQLMGSKQSEVNQLSQEKSEKNSTIANLNKKEKDLRSKLRKQEKEAKKLEEAIQDIIAAEIKASEASRNSESVTKGSFALTPKELELSENFVNNKGKLPWPSERGIISSTFGEHRHPVLKKVKVKNNGIDILTHDGAKARAIFDGMVISVKRISNTNLAVIIRHGEYFTVYSNLSQAYVKRGETVNRKQEIGKVFTNKEESKTELHFEIWKGKSLLNPAYWLVNKK